MVESELLLSPQDDGDAVALSNKTFRKRILPKATINYRGRKITFDAAYLADLANSFKDGAYDQVAFMMAPDNNSHTLDPERFRGEIKQVEVGDDGLYGIFSVTPEAAKVLEQNPKLGVSARILENYQRSDGKQFPRALQHVLGTLDPVIPGLGTWEEVALSNGVAVENVIDLSATSYEELEHMATRADHLQQVAEATDMTVEDLEALDMTDEELAIFASAFVPDGTPEASADADDSDELIEEPGEPGLLDLDADTEMDLPTEEDIEAAVENLTDDELEALAAELGLTAEDTEGETEAVAEEETEVTAEAAAEPTTAELVERLGTGDFNSGLGTEDPTLGTDADLDDLTDEDFAALWETARAKDEAAEGSVEAEALAEEAAAQAAAEAETEPAPVLVGAGSVSLSNEAGPEIVSLSNQVALLQHELALQQFTTLKAEYVRKGVPAALVDLARPVLIAGSAATLEFSNQVGGIETVDASAIVRQLLDSATGYIDLARERGHSYSPESDDREAMAAQEDKHLASLWGEQYGRH
jgi:uncharacterized protein YdbL (DUF1318 family)